MASELFNAWTIPSGSDPLIGLHDSRSGTRFLMKINEDLSYTTSSEVLNLNYVNSICFKDNKVYMCIPARGTNGPFIGTVDINSDGTFYNAKETAITSLSHNATGYTEALVYTNGTTVFAAFAYNSSSEEIEFFSLNGTSYTKIKTVSGLSLGKAVTYDVVRNRFVSIGVGNSEAEILVSENGVDWVSKGTIPHGITKQRQLYITEGGDYIVNG